MFNEEEFYNQIFDKFVKLSSDLDKIEVWKDRFFIDLMLKLKQEHDVDFVQNALVVIMALFEDHLKDGYYRKSKNAKKLAESAKLELIEDLKEALAL